MASGLTEVLVALRDGVTAMNKLTLQIKNTFASITASSTTAPATNGTITFSSSLALGFALLTTSSGATVKVPFYNQ